MSIENAKFTDYITKSLENRVIALQEALGHGCAADYADYKYVIGQIQGLAFAVDFIKETLKNQENDNDL